MSELKGRVVMITSAGRGVGAAICNELALYGARLAVVDAWPPDARETAHRLQRIGVEAFPVTADPADEGDVVRALAEVRRRYGQLHALVNNASALADESATGGGTCEWDRVIAHNLRGSFLLARHAVPLLKQCAGHVVNIAYGHGTESACGSASTWGLLGLAHALRAELRRYDVKLTTVLPGGESARLMQQGGSALDLACLLDPVDIAGAVRKVLLQPQHALLPEITVVPSAETSLP